MARKLERNKEKDVEYNKIKTTKVVDNSKLESVFYEDKK